MVICKQLFIPSPGGDSLTHIHNTTLLRIRHVDLTVCYKDSQSHINYPSYQGLQSNTPCLLKCLFMTVADQLHSWIGMPPHWPFLSICNQLTSSWRHFDPQVCFVLSPPELLMTLCREAALISVWGEGSSWFLPPQALIHPARPAGGDSLGR